MFCWHPCPTLTYYCGLVSVSQWPLKLFLKVFKRLHSAREWLVPGARWSPSVTFLSELAPSNDVCCLPGAQIFPGDDFKWLWHQPQEVPMLLGLAAATVTTSSGLCNAMAHCAPTLQQVGRCLTFFVLMLYHSWFCESLDVDICEEQKLQLLFIIFFFSKFLLLSYIAGRFRKTNQYVCLTLSQ